jgi:hypothetical protein
MLFCELSFTGFNNRCEFNKNLTNKTNIKLWEIVVSKLTQRKDFFECNVNFLKEWRKEMHFNEYWNDLIMNQLLYYFLWYLLILGWFKCS